MSRGIARLLAPMLALLAPIIRPAAAGDAPKPKTPIAITASPAILPAGAPCRVVLRPEEEGGQVVKVAYEGTIVRADDGGVLLAVSGYRREVGPLHPVGVPVLDRLNRSIGVARHKPGEGPEVWLLSESIQSLALLARPERMP